MNKECSESDKIWLAILSRNIRMNEGTIAGMVRKGMFTWPKTKIVQRVLVKEQISGI